MTTKTEILDLLLQIQHLPNSPINDMNIDRIVTMYTDDLGDIPVDVLSAAVKYYRTDNNPFFPTSGQLREKATDLLLMAMKVPTAAEAWNQVQTAVRFVDSVWCDEGARLFNDVAGKTGHEYWDALHAYKQHSETCTLCDRGGFREVYSHPVVENIVKRLGGRDRILTDNPVADRSQFIKAYNDIASLEVKRATMPEAIKQTVASIAGARIQQLADGMTQ